jgi:hypothetical protein
MRIAREPDILERALVPLADLEAIHGDIHGWFPSDSDAISARRT